jgi:hypothetical protein
VNVRAGEERAHLIVHLLQEADLSRPLYRRVTLFTATLRPNERRRISQNIS